ncbi:MAG: hypothetical protein IT323_16525 [Anaerolineae bacterium]|nr:hypothetical protein [Anaerolineae bacterium]
MKYSRSLVTIVLLSLVALLVMAPMAEVTAQDPTATPAIVIITATPAGGAQPQPTTAPGGAAPGGAATVAPAPADPNATPQPPGWAPFDAARQVLARKINTNLRYVDNWFWELAMFPDSMLGCAPEGQTPVAGETAGYRVTIKPLGNPNTYELRVTIDLKTVYDCGIAGTAPAGTAGGGSLAAGAAVAGNFELGGHVLELNAGTLGRVREARMTWVKSQFRPGDGNAISFIQNAKANGLKALVSIVGTPSDIGRGDAFFAEYATYVASLASAGADGIEIWNEMNLDREWPTGQINPASYVNGLLKRAYQAIKAANPNTMVITGAPAPTGAAGPGGKTDAYWNDDVYMQGMAEAGAAQAADCIGVHYNEGIVSPNQGSGDPRDSYPTRYFSTMLQRAMQYFPGMRACFTELGYLSPEGYGALPSGFAWAGNVTVANQAQWLAEAAVAAARSNVRLMIVWNVDFPFFGGSDPTGGYAIIRPGGGCPACATLGQVMAR